MPLPFLHFNLFISFPNNCKVINKTMAVQARHLNLFPPQILTNRDSAANGVQVNGNVFAAPFGYGVAAETAVPMYGGSANPTKCDSGLTSYAPVSRKRSRDDVIDSLLSSFPGAGSFTFLGEDISFHIQQQQLEIDRFVAQHTEKVRMEIEERRKRYSRRIAAAVEEKVKAIEEEIHKMGKQKYALEERVKSLCVENQIWRDLAQSNEATANALRSDLEQVVAQVHDEQLRRRRGEAADDGNSWCGSNTEEEEDEERLKRVCRGCWREESCVLVLPCRHLCLCSICGATRHTCPVCNATKTATVHVNLTA